MEPVVVVAPVMLPVVEVEPLGAVVVFVVEPAGGEPVVVVVVVPEVVEPAGWLVVVPVVVKPVVVPVVGEVPAVVVVVDPVLVAGTATATLVSAAGAWAAGARQRASSRRAAQISE